MSSCSAKGSKIGNGSSVAHFFVCISSGKGVIFCEQYEKLNGQYFTNFVGRNFKTIFSLSYDPEGNLFIQEGDPSQNSKLRKTKMRSCGTQLLAIPPRSPDINPIENIFHLIGQDLS